jgi:hypothetical protein
MGSDDPPSRGPIRVRLRRLDPRSDHGLSSGLERGCTDMFTAAQLAQDGGPAPTQTIRGLTDANGLAFDASGNAWVARKGGISMLTPAQLTAGPSANPLAWASTSARTWPSTTLVDCSSRAAAATTCSGSARIRSPRADHRRHRP